MISPRQKNSISIVLIEDDPDDVFLIKDLLSDARFLECKFTAANDFTTGLEKILQGQADIYLIDHHLGARRGVDLIFQARKAGVQRPMILLTGNDSPEVDREAQAAGASDYILKSEITTFLLERSIRYAISQWEAAQAHEQLVREQLRREEAEHREAQWQLWSETIPYGLWVTDEKGQVEYVSRSFLQLVNLAGQNNSQLAFKELLPEKLQDKWQQTLATGQQWSQEIELTDGDDNQVYVLSRGRPIRDQANEIRQWVGINLDITEEKKLEQRKDEFLQIASHELKSPITSILSNLYILKDQLADGQLEAGSQYVKRMERQLRNLTRLVEDLLDLSKIEMEKLSYYPEIINLNELISQVVEDMETSVDHTITVTMEQDVYLEADRQRLRQVLVNLLSNAVKYSPEADTVELTVKSNDNRVKIMVTDYGVGISEQDLDKVFDKFYSGKDSSAKDIGGLGLGLFLTRKIVSLHQGEMKVESQVGEGSTFKVELPIKQNL